MLVLQLIVLAVWVWVVVRTVVRLRSVSRRNTDGGQGIVRNFLVDPAHIGDRRTLGWATFALVLATLAFTLTR